MGFVLLGLFSVVVVLAGALSPSTGTALIGVGGLALAAGGLALYWRVTRTWHLARLYPDRLEFVRGPQRGTLPLSEVTAAHHLQWERSLFPYSRGHRLLVLVTAAAEWQLGPEILGHEAFQEAVLAALSANRDRHG